jgi:hypothetical protein
MGIVTVELAGSVRLRRLVARGQMRRQLGRQESWVQEIECQKSVGDVILLSDRIYYCLLAAYFDAMSTPPSGRVTPLAKDLL